MWGQTSPVSLEQLEAGAGGEVWRGLQNQAQNSLEKKGFGGVGVAEEQTQGRMGPEGGGHRGSCRSKGHRDIGQGQTVL